MKINDTNLPGLNGAQAKAAEKTRQTTEIDGLSQERTEQRTADGDRVQLSGLSQVLRSDGEESPERLDRINQLKQAYDSGQYQPDAATVSRSVVDATLKGE